MVRNGGMGVIEEGPLKGRKFIIPSEVYVEKGTFIGGSAQFSKACLIHHKFIPDGGCPDCKTEVETKQHQAAAIGL